jgi:hypothetical protein
MKRGYIFVVLPVVLCSLQACVLFKNGAASAPLEGRYKTLLMPVPLNEAEAPIKINVTSSLNPDPVDTTKPRTIMNLQGQGQRELISQYSKLYKKPSDFKDALNTIYFKKKDDGSPTDFSNKSITVTISVTKVLPATITAKDLALGDRLEMITMNFSLDDSLQGVYFKSWDHFKTQYGRFFIGSRSFTGNQDLTISPSVTLANTAAFSAGSYASNSQYTEQDTLSQQVVVSNGILNDKSFLIDQTGTPKTSLMGNSILNITIGSKTPVRGTFFSFDTLFNGPKIVSPDKIKVSLKNYIIADNSKDITGTLRCNYRYRHITGGDRTYGESDDTVQYKYGTITVPNVKLIEKKNLKPRYWYIQNTIDKKNLEIKDLFNASLNNYDLAFGSYDEAEDFIAWLSQLNIPGNAVATLPAVKVPKKKPAKKPIPVPLTKYIFNGRYELVTSQGAGRLAVSTPVAPGYPTAALIVMVTQP